MTQINIETIKTNISNLVKHDDFTFHLGVAGNPLIATLTLSLLVATGALGYYETVGFNFMLSFAIGLGLLILDRQRGHKDIPAWTLIVPLVYVFKRAKKGVNLKALFIALTVCYCVDMVLVTQVEKAALVNDVKATLDELVPTHTYEKVSLGEHIETRYFDDARLVNIVWFDGHREELAVALSHENSTVSLHNPNSVL